ncbi:MAG: ubiquinol-cytochrome c reductase iron-sulfur subunit [Candidatus Limnocylindria bacterium]
MTHSYGEVAGPRAGEISRRTFMRRMLGLGVGILGLQFLGATVAFLWPNLKGGLGGKIDLGTLATIVSNNPSWAGGEPFAYTQARLFIVNVPAAKALVEGQTNVSMTNPSADEILALYRTCPHLGCQIPPLCQASKWFECLCHGSKYTVLGEKRDGPAPRGMDRFPVAMEGDKVVVDTAEKISGPPVGTVTFDDRSPGSIPHCTG